jgi:hypothetical protein
MIRQTAKILAVGSALALATCARADEKASTFAPAPYSKDLIAPQPPNLREGAPPALECFSLQQTRQHIVQFRLLDPVSLMQATSAAHQGQALSAKLCRSGEKFLYEINVLRRDGRIVRVFLDATNGKTHPLHTEHPTHLEH